MTEHMRGKRQTVCASGLKPRRKAGFALVDALTALAILATTLSLSLGVANTSRRVAASAAETRAAQVALQFLNERRLETPGNYDGELPRGRWRIALAETRPNATGRAFAVCHRTTEFSAKSGRRFSASTMEPCPPPVDRP